MNCQEAMNLWSSYQDGELDRGFCAEIHHHLAACADCHRFFEAQAEFDAALTRTLKQPPPAVLLWRRQESAVRAAFRSLEPNRAPRSSWVGLLWPSPAFYGALAACWLVLLVANRWADHDGGTPRNQEPSAARQAILAEQRREFKALLMALDFSPTPTVTQPPGPRNRWQSAPGLMPTTSLRQMPSIQHIS